MLDLVPGRYKIFISSAEVQNQNYVEMHGQQNIKFLYPLFVRRGLAHFLLFF
jgi:hypothetical protein